jgi:hypothetical protein
MCGQVSLKNEWPEEEVPWIKVTQAYNLGDAKTVGKWLLSRDFCACYNHQGKNLIKAGSRLYNWLQEVNAGEAAGNGQDQDL